MNNHAQAKLLQMRAMGVDGCAGGWVGVVIDHAGFVGAAYAPTIKALADAADQVGPVDGFGIDVPIGLHPDRFRRADVAARVELRTRRSTVFVTPPRPALEAASHAEATHVCRQVTGAGVSMQAYRLRDRIFDVDAWLRDAQAKAPVWEVHPELSFALLAGGPLALAKTSWSGLARRIDLLKSAGIVVPALIGDAGLAAPDDVVDAAAVAWSCRRLLAGMGRCWPDPPEPGPSGRPIAIWA